VRAKTIAVDPSFRAEIDIIGKKPALHVSRNTSDDFFAKGFRPRNDIRPSPSLLAGMHPFGYLLRDVVNTEAASDPKGVIPTHVLVPDGLAMASRGLAASRGTRTGDVRKRLPILRRGRPDRKRSTPGLRPTGPPRMSDLSPGSRVQQENHAAVGKEFMAQDLETFGVGRCFDSFAHTDAPAMKNAGFPLFRDLALDPAAALEPRRHRT
jgi:hypothetical protein